MRRRVFIFISLVLVFLGLFVFTVFKFIPPDEAVYTESNWIQGNFILGWQFEDLNRQQRDSVKEKYGKFTSDNYDLWARDTFVFQNKTYYFIHRYEKPFYIYNEKDEVFIELADNFFGNMMLHDTFIYFSVNLETVVRYEFIRGEGFPFWISKIKYRLLEYKKVDLLSKEISEVSKEEFQQLYDYYEYEVYDKRFE